MNESDKRLLAEKLGSAETRVRSAMLSLEAQQKGVKAGLGLLPERIDDVDAATQELPYPVSGTTYTAVPGIQGFPANTWVKVQEFVIAPPTTAKNTAQLFLTCTALIRYSGSYATNTLLSRVKVNGQTFPVAPVLQTGFAVAGGSFSNMITVSVEIYLSDPSLVTNDTGAGRENSIRTFTMAVWS